MNSFILRKFVSIITFHLKNKINIWLTSLGDVFKSANTATLSHFIWNHKIDIWFISLSDLFT